MGEEKDKAKLYAVDSDGEVLGEIGGDEEGKSIDDLAEDETFGYELRGTEEQLSFEVGSEYELRSAFVKIPAAGELGVVGQFREGDRIKVLLEIEVEHVSFPPIKHKGFRVGTERLHHVQIIDAAQA